MKKLIIIILFLVLVSSVSAIGIAPSSKEILNTENAQFSLKIINNQNQEVELEINIPPEYKNAITVSQETIYFTKTDGYKKIDVSVDASKFRTLAKGTNRIPIQIKQKSDDAKNIGATINLEFYLNVIVPYEGAVLKTQFLPSNFKSDSPGMFVVRAKNVGTEDIFNGIMSVDIFTTANQKITSIVSSKKNIIRGETVDFQAEWIPDVENGKYVAKITMLYNGRSEASEHIITVGKPEVNIDSISTNSFTLGGVAGFDMIVSNAWAERIDNVFAEVQFLKGSQLLNKVKSPSQDIEGFGKAILPIYWDTVNLEPGLYKMVATLHYMENSKTETFDVVMDQNKISVGEMVGKVTGGQKNEEGFDFSILIILVLAILIINILLFIKLRKKK